MQAKQLISQERANVDDYKTELAELRGRVARSAATILGASFKNVKAKFYDVIVRTDVGTVDVAWSQKEDADDDLKRLNLSQQRDLKQLKDEFKDILDGRRRRRRRRAAAPAPPPGPRSRRRAPTRATGAGRVTPGSESRPRAATPVVRPDNETQGPLRRESPHARKIGLAR